MKRAERRFHSQRLKKKARKIAKNNWGFAEKDLKRAEKLADHLKSCSCSMCCNSRRRESFDASITKQEYDAYLSYLEQIGHDCDVKHCDFGKKSNYYSDKEQI